MNLSSSRENGTQVVTVNAARIDAMSAIQFKDAMRSQTGDGEDRVVLDLSQVDFVDSSGLGAIVASMKQLGGARRMDLAALQGNVDKVFKLTRMDTVFRIYACVENALEDPIH